MTGLAIKYAYGDLFDKVAVKVAVKVNETIKENNMNNVNGIDGSALTVTVGEAMNRKIEAVLAKYDDKHEALLAVSDESKVEIEAINKRLWKNITKDEIVAGLVDENDGLSLTGLLANDKVKEALEATIAVHQRQGVELLENCKQYVEIQGAVDVEIDAIETDVVLFGLPAVQDRLKNFEGFVGGLLAEV